MINVPVRRLRPNRAALGALLGLVWLVSVGPIRDFVWADLREGMVRLNGISRGTRALIVVGFSLLVLGAGLIVFDDALRALFELIPMSSAAAAGLAGRGAAFPTALIPITLFLLVLGWSYLLAGAMHSHPLIRLVALIVYAGHFIPWLGRGLSVLDTSPLALLVVALALLGVPVLYVVRWRRAARPVLEFFLCLGFLGIILLVAQAQGVALWRAGGQPVLLSNIEAAVFSLEALVLPMLFLIGVDIANFTKHAAGWIVALAVARFPRWLVGLLLAIALVDRLYAVAVELMERLKTSDIPAQATEYAGALGEIACVAAVWWLVSYVASRKNSTEIAERSPDRVLEAADTYAFKVILGFTAAALATVVFAGIALALHGIPG
ncbi:MAG TPA: hypothetical protein VGW38_17270, partial [Chloroflexota bacterium]|nr:hypothetical protein [Chloroflexota bacterium]